MQPTGTIPKLLLAVFLLLLGIGLLAFNTPGAQHTQQKQLKPQEISVTTTADSGEGSLRRAILKANTFKGASTIRFDSVNGPFDTPQTIKLKRALPVLAGRITIDGTIPNSLWKPVGVTINGGGRHQIFKVPKGSHITLGALTLEQGKSSHGGAVLNNGNLVVKGVTFTGNVAKMDGAAVANNKGSLTVINSTFFDNRAENRGGGVANLHGSLTVTNATFSENEAAEGGGIFSDGELLLRNTIVANSKAAHDCVAIGNFDTSSSHNLIESHKGCGMPITTSDPRLEKLGLYNGSTPTLPLGGGSPAVNMGHNASALDENGNPLKWDQRGNGDPRFVGGITDIGAFERQANPILTVDTLEDEDMRGCSWGSRKDCSLRGAILLANATEKPDTILFSPEVFSAPQIIRPVRALPKVTADLLIDAREVGEITLEGTHGVLHVVGRAKLETRGIRENFQ